MSKMNLEEALRIAAIFEADDVIAVPAMACRVMAKAIQDLSEQIVDLKLEAAKPLPSLE